MGRKNGGTARRCGPRETPQTQVSGRGRGRAAASARGDVAPFVRRSLTRHRMWQGIQRQFCEQFTWCQQVRSRVSCVLCCMSCVVRACIGFAVSLCIGRDPQSPGRPVPGMGRGALGCRARPRFGLVVVRRWAFLRAWHRASQRTLRRPPLLRGHEDNITRIHRAPVRCIGQGPLYGAPQTNVTRLRSASTGLSHPAERGTAWIPNDAWMVSNRVCCAT